MKRRLSMVLSMFMLVGFIWGGGPGVTVWANDPPGIPIGLTATATSHSTINVTWTPVGDAQGYELYQGEQSIGEMTASSFEHIGLTPNTSYTYKVRSFKDVEEMDGETPITTRIYSGFSSSVSALTPPAPVSIPAAPASLTAVALDAARIRLTWTAGAGTVDGFYVEQMPVGGSWQQVQTITNPSTTTFESTGLTANTTYYYRVRAYNSGGLSPYSNQVTIATPALVVVPSKPTNLTISQVTANQMTLTWKDNSGNETGFKIERKTGNGTYAEIATVGANAVTFTNTGLNGSTTYSYRVRSYNAAGNSDYSNEATAATLSVIPAKPTNLSVSPMSNNQVTLTWKDNATNETGFKIERKTGNGSFSEIATVAANVVTFTNTGLSNNTAYTYRVRAYNAAGNSDYSNEATVAPLAVAPAKPTNLEASQVGDNQVKLVWKDNATNETGYKIERKTGSGNYSEIATVSANITNYTNTGLSNNTTYTYRVRAYNAVGNSDYSNEAAVTIASVPAKPDELKITSTSTDRLTITWKDNSSNEKGFRIERKTGSGNFSEIATVSANATSYTNTGLSNNTTYTYRVRAYNDAGNSNYSNEVSGKTGVALTKPENLEASEVSTDRVTLAWKDKSDNEKGFIIERKTGSGSYSEVATVKSNTTSYTDTRLSNNTTYTYRVQAYNDDGRSEYSNELKVTTGLTPEKPTALSVTLVAANSIKIEWKDNSDNETGFKIERKIGNGSYSEVATVKSNTTTYTNTGLQNRTEYTYRVRAYNETGNSAFSNEISAVTGLVPEAPDQLTVTSEETYQISLAWRDRSSNEDGFILERKTSTGSFTKVATLSANTTVYIDRNLTGGQSYTYRIKAYNNSGESPVSNEVVARTKLETIVPPITEVVTRLAIGSSQYQVNGQLRQMDAVPVIYESRTLLPIRYVAEAVGATVQWDAMTEKVTVMLDNTVVELWIGNNIAKVNGVSTQIDANNSQVKPLILPPGRTMIPLAFVSRSLGCNVQWNDLTQEVTVTYAGR
ncbi:fibronectin type III domain-containing protein [Anoxynatronum buryatiense]|uniref:Fibronectin type 3 domain-containing protein n=1 Tax=Anoxynatronum buryatiense TaxID=489973 RepID=A0AA45WX34_9CLOT|nr:fibronectin type III domain-containing protein [Anoxynatronum buryatiense]SMP61713.1 fibronectin type 3 domain-containing protein [Anoxynatronum buryatiense]